MKELYSQPKDVVRLCKLDIDRVDQQQALNRMFGQLTEGVGGWLITANLDHLQRHTMESDIRRLYSGAGMVVADGMPLVWASRLAGTALPERVAGSDLLLSISERAATEKKSVYFLGGAGSVAEEAAVKLSSAYPGLIVAGTDSPWISETPESAELAVVRQKLLDARPDIIFVALGSPKQENLIAALKEDLPQSWWIGVGISFSFVAGSVSRAPLWMQKSGLEWVHRMVKEPRRLLKRYLLNNIPFSVYLMLWALVRRIS